MTASDEGDYNCSAPGNRHTLRMLVEDKFCEGEHDAKHSIYWRRTKADSEISGQCPDNKTGSCSRKCNSKAIWSTPNCNGCVDTIFKDLLDKVKNVSADDLKNQTVIDNIAKKLSIATNESEGLSPGNLNASVTLINRLADLRSNSIVSASPKEIKSIVQAASNVLQPNNSRAWQDLEDVNKSIATSILFSLEVYGKSLSTLNISENGTQEVEDNLVLKAWSFEKSNLPRQIEFRSGSVWGENRDDGISISVETLNNSISSEGLRMWGVYYRTVSDYLPENNNTDVINSRVLSLSIGGLNTNETPNQTVLITLRHNERKRIVFQRTCAFWDFKRGDWDSEGCSVNSTNSTHTICSCNHLTNFAVLMSRNPKHDDKLLSIISIIGCSISIVALILTIIVYALTWKQAKSAQATVLINLCVALIIAYIIFLLGADKFKYEIYSKHGCTAVAALLHYFFLAAFFIMLAEGAELVLYIIFVFHVRRTRETIMLIVTAWVLPLIVVGVSLGTTQLTGYGHEKACWLSVENGLIWAFVGPVLFIVTVNFLILTIVLTWMSKRKALLAKDAKKRDDIKATFWNLSVTCPVLGLGWLFGVLSISFDHVVFQYLFVIANSMQGLLIFIFHAVFHNKKMNEKLSALYSNCMCRCRKTELNVSSKMTSGQEQSTSSTAATQVTSYQDQYTCSEADTQMISAKEQTTSPGEAIQMTSAQVESRNSTAATQMTSAQEESRNSTAATQITSAQEESRNSTAATQMTSAQEKSTSSDGATQMTLAEEQPANIANQAGFVPMTVKYYEEIIGKQDNLHSTGIQLTTL